MPLSSAQYAQLNIFMPSNALAQHLSTFSIPAWLTCAKLSQAPKSCSRALLKTVERISEAKELRAVIRGDAGKVGLTSENAELVHIAGAVVNWLVCRQDAPHMSMHGCCLL
jgi:hypothetical protein